MDGRKWKTAFRAAAHNNLEQPTCDFFSQTGPACPFAQAILYSLFAQPLRRMRIIVFIVLGRSFIAPIGLTFFRQACD